MRDSIQYIAFITITKINLLEYLELNGPIKK